tara:strand:- start:4421 stop:5068 length:648 start_codon:yes stop_codon:yes gene_type:complete
MKKIYAVHRGKNPGIYEKWSECEKNVKGYNGAVFKKFSNMEEAEYFVKTGKLLEEVEEKEDGEIMYIYTDGSSLNNGMENCRAGYGVYFGENDGRNMSEEIFDLPSNQRAELYGIEKAIKKIENSIDKYDKICIYTDSDYSIKCVTKYVDRWLVNGWKTSKDEDVKNRDLIEEIYKYISKYSKIELKHVYSHTNKKDRHSIGNERADNLAYKSIS